MKNIIKIIILFTTFFIMSKTSLAKESYIELGEEIPNIKIHIKTSVREEDINMYKIIDSATNELIYSLEPNNIFQNNYHEENYFNQISNRLTKDYISAITRIAYFGYGYQDRTDIKWYIATQFLIWNYNLKDNEEIYFIDSNNNKIDLYQSEMKTILNDVENYKTLPSFANKDYHEYDGYAKYSDGEFVIEDTNNVLHDYNVIVYTNADTKIEDNKLHIIFKEMVERMSIFFNRKIDISLDPAKIYYNDTSSTNFLKRGQIDLTTGVYTIRVIAPSLTIKKKLDILSPEGEEFNLYFENGNLYQRITIDKNGLGIMEEIIPGKYYLEEVKTPYGYEPIKDKIYFEIEKDNLTLNIDNLLIEKKVTLKKYIIDDNEKELDTSATYKVYDSNDKLIKDVSINKKEGAIFNLPYGNYKIIETKGKEGYTISEPIEIKIDENYDETKAIEIDSKKITGSIIINKLDKDTKKLISVPSKIKILNIDTNEYLKINDQEIFEIKEGYLKLNNIPYGNYQVIEESIPIGYKKSQNKDNFSIKNSETIKIDILNSKATGTIIIKKIDFLTGKPLANVSFGIYNSNKKLIKKVTTNKEGEIKLEDILIGKYYIKEIQAEDDLDLNGSEIEIEAKENIESTITINNKSNDENKENNNSTATTSNNPKDEEKENNDSTITTNNHAKDEGKKEDITQSIIDNRFEIAVPKTGTSEFTIGFIISTIFLLIGVSICNDKEK